MTVLSAVREAPTARAFVSSVVASGFATLRFLPVGAESGAALVDNATQVVVRAACWSLLVPQELCRAGVDLVRVSPKTDGARRLGASSRRALSKRLGGLG